MTSAASSITSIRYSDWQHVSMNDSSELDFLVSQVVQADTFDETVMEVARAAICFNDGSLNELGEQLKNFNPELFARIFSDAVRAPAAASEVVPKRENQPEKAPAMFRLPQEFITAIEKQVLDLTDHPDFENIRALVDSISKKPFKSREGALAFLADISNKLVELLSKGKSDSDGSEARKNPLIITIFSEIIKLDDDQSLENIELRREKEETAPATPSSEAGEIPCIPKQGEESGICQRRTPSIRFRKNKPTSVYMGCFSRIEDGGFG